MTLRAGTIYWLCVGTSVPFEGSAAPSLNQWTRSFSDEFESDDSVDEDDCAFEERASPSAHPASSCWGLGSHSSLQSVGGVGPILLWLTKKGLYTLTSERKFHQGPGPACRISTSHFEASDVLVLLEHHVPALSGTGKIGPFVQSAKSNRIASATFFHSIAHGGSCSPHTGAMRGKGSPCRAIWEAVLWEKVVIYPIVRPSMEFDVKLVG